MKKILIPALLSVAAYSSSLFAAGAGDLSTMPEMEGKSASGWSGMLGLAALSAPEYVGGDDSEGAGLPVIIVDYNDRFYFKVNTLGVWLWKPNDSFRIGLAAKPRKGWESDDGDLLDGRSDRDDQTEFGVNFRWNHEKLTVEGMFLSASDESEGSSALLKARYMFIQNSDMALIGGVDIENLDEDIVDFYYGTDGTEVAGTPVYEGDSVTNTSVMLAVMYNINKEWMAVGGVKATSLGDEISDSPIVEDDAYNVIFAGAVWKF